MLRKDDTGPIHQRNIQALAVEMFNVENNIVREIMKYLFIPIMTLYDHHNNNLFHRRKVKVCLA